MPIHLKFTLTFEDFINAHRLHARHKGPFSARFVTAPYVWFVLGACFLLLALFNAVFGIAGPSPIFLASVGFIFALCPLYYQRRLIRRYRLTRSSDETAVEIEEELIRFKTENMSSECQWKAVRLFLEDSKLVLLYIAPIKFIPLPKHAFAPEQLAELQSLLARQGVPTRAELPRPTWSKFLRSER
jgi:hypothetical protein